MERIFKIIFRFTSLQIGRNSALDKLLKENIKTISEENADLVKDISNILFLIWEILIVTYLTTTTNLFLIYML